MTTIIRTIIIISLVLISTFQSFAQQQDVSIGLEIDSAHSVLFGVPLDSAGSRMVWHPQKGALLVGAPFNVSDWHIDSIGDNSFSIGSGNTPYGFQATTFGFGNSVHRFSFNGTAFGFLNRIGQSGSYSTVGGRGNVTNAENSVVFGSDNNLTTDAHSSFVLGTDNELAGNHAFVHGEQNDVSGSYSMVMGRKCEVDAEFCTTNGSANRLYGLASSAFGAGLVTKGAMSMVVGIANDTTLQFEGNQNDFMPTPETPLFVVGNGTAEDDRSNALSVFASGFVKIGSDTAVADLHIKQSMHSNDVSSAGIRLENSFDNDYWQIYSSGDFLNFGKFGTSLAFIDSDGNYVDNAMLFHEGDERLPIAKSLNKQELQNISLRESRDKKGNRHLKLDSKSLEKHMPDLIKYDAKGNPHHIDQNQLILRLLAQLQEHEKVIVHQSKLLLEQGELLKKLSIE